MDWYLTHKGDLRCQRLADRHYSRQQPGTWSWTRPGYNYVLYTSDTKGEAVFCWWRPADGIERMDKLHAIECTIFRNESSLLSSDLIKQACSAVQTWKHYDPSYTLITGISSLLTKRGRSAAASPGACFVHAGWNSFEKTTKLADVWLTINQSQLSMPILPLITNTKYHEARPPQPVNELGLTGGQMTQFRKWYKTLK